MRRDIHVHIHHSAATSDNWQESKHPRAPDGKFGSGGSSSSSSGEGGEEAASAAKIKKLRKLVENMRAKKVSPVHYHNHRADVFKTERELDALEKAHKQKFGKDA
jgi:hypothetical protein